MHDSLLRPTAQIVLGETVAKVFSVSRCLSFAKERATWLTAAEIGTLRALHQSSDRDRYLVAHVLGREVIADVVGVAANQVEIERAPCVRCTKPHGKPTVKGHSAGVSLSHAGASVAVAVGPGAVGIDVEVRPSLEAMRELAPLLHANVSWPRGSVASTESDGGREFLRMWTRVEAVLKARGVGLLDGLHGVDPTVNSPLLIDQVIDQDHHVALSVEGHP